MTVTGEGIAVGVMAVNEGFVSRWVGPGQYAGAGLSALLLVNLALRQLNLTAGSPCSASATRSGWRSPRWGTAW